MKIAIIGAGSVGSALARGWARKGHDLLLGVRDPADGAVQSLCQETRAQARLVREAADAAAVVVLALPWNAAAEAIETLGPLAGKIVIDCMNPLTLRDGVLVLERGFATSAGEAVAEWLPEARIVKTLNQVGAAVMADTSGFAAPPVMFMASNHAEAKTTVAGLLADLGFEPLDAGDLIQSRYLEPYAMVWINQTLYRGKSLPWAFGALTRAARST
jgi:predicted dinucleotide-binding enzyme